MHCECPGYSTFMILPPYNTIRAQVFKTASDHPQMVTSGITISYAFTTPNETDNYLINTDPYFNNSGFGWIKYSPKLFPGFQPVVNGKVMSIAGTPLEGNMTFDSASQAWIAKGVPAFAVTTGTADDVMLDPFGGPNRDPYLTLQVTAKDSHGTTLASTQTVVPVAFGGCCGCHLPLAAANGYPQTPQGSFQYMGKMHSQNGSNIDFSMIDPDGDGQGGPIRCSWCHWDPAMGESAAPGLANVWPNYQILPGAGFTKSQVRTSKYSFSYVLHAFHAQDTVVLTQYDPNIAKDCYNCHPGNGVNCYRDVHVNQQIWCTDCHGDLNQRLSTNQYAQPWQQSTLPTCQGSSPGINSIFTCHTNVSTQGGQINGVFGAFINGWGHEGQVLCSTCHGSPHMLAPSNRAADNIQNNMLQGKGSFPSGKNASYPIGVCNVCHNDRGTTWKQPPHSYTSGERGGHDGWGWW